MKKIKQIPISEGMKNILVILVVILVGLGSFGLGRLSKDSQNPGITVKYSDVGANIISALEPVEGRPYATSEAQIEASKSELAPKVLKNSAKFNSGNKAFFASSRGSKYYSIGCSGGKTLKPENKIYFATEAEAISAGYQKSSTCK